MERLAREIERGKLSRVATAAHSIEGMHLRSPGRSRNGSGWKLPTHMWRLNGQGTNDGMLHLLSGELVLELALLEMDSCLGCVLDASRAARPGTGMRRSHRHVGNGRGCRRTYKHAHTIEGRRS